MKTKGRTSVVFAFFVWGCDWPRTKSANEYSSSFSTCAAARQSSKLLYCSMHSSKANISCLDTIE
jgi:hypothetical protein